jgi:AAA15 family ATPase/GTPase
VLLNNSHAYALSGYECFTLTKEDIKRETPKSFCSEQSQNHNYRTNEDVTEEVETAGESKVSPVTGRGIP